MLWVILAAAAAAPAPSVLLTDVIDAYTIDEWLQNPCPCTTTAVVTRTLQAPSYAPLVLLTVCVISITVCMVVLEAKHKLA